MPEIIVHALAGRTLEQKSGPTRDIAEAVIRRFAAPAEAFTVQIVECSPSEKARGGFLSRDR
jgi:4-oxalocrotonate tautomerase